MVVCMGLGFFFVWCGVEELGGVGCCWQRLRRPSLSGVWYWRTPELWRLSAVKACLNLPTPAYTQHTPLPTP